MAKVNRPICIRHFKLRWTFRFRFSLLFVLTDAFRHYKSWGSPGTLLKSASWFTVPFRPWLMASFLEHSKDFHSLFTAARIQKGNKSGGARRTENPRNPEQCSPSEMIVKELHTEAQTFLLKQFRTRKLAPAADKTQRKGRPASGITRPGVLFTVFSANKHVAELKTRVHQVGTLRRPN